MSGADTLDIDASSGNNSSHSELMETENNVTDKEEVESSSGPARDNSILNNPARLQTLIKWEATLIELKLIQYFSVLVLVAVYTVSENS